MPAKAWHGRPDLLPGGPASGDNGFAVGSVQPRIAVDCYPGVCRIDLLSSLPVNFSVSVFCVVAAGAPALCCSTAVNPKAP
jgi:hypothetical protein